ncbi:MAG: putative DNA binding domain-containing protein [Tannerella sp.]|jgi:predicted HTH transcriptional regulator|nr:putative DNA binding domain-containing protein [Tannerella sp.]
MNINEIIKKAEGRRLELKSQLPDNADLAKTIIAFANDAGGELYIGISDQPRTITGIAEDQLFEMEEKISNIIYNRCYPAILPDITFLSEDDKHVIRITVYRGSAPPYHLKEKGKLSGTYIRIGSTNRLADESIIAELERKRRNISYDSETIMDKPVNQLNIDTFVAIFKEKTGETLDVQTLKKLDLIKELNGVMYPTHAMVLFSDDELRNSFFHFAKVECARFKGQSPDEFIDRKSITSNIAAQAEEAYNFVLRHINEGATVEGVYTVSKWEYPVKAVREVIRNAVVHRDYSLTGKDIKVAVYDHLIEITSPGLLPPSIDYSAMESRQSDARNKVIAPVFKRLGVIDQWGNGLKLIASELKAYPRIRLQWKEVGMSFQVQFIKRDFEEGQELQERRAEYRAGLGEEIEHTPECELDIEAGLRAGLQYQQQGSGANLEKAIEYIIESEQNIGAGLRARLKAGLRADLMAELEKTTLYSDLLWQLNQHEMNKQELAVTLDLENISGHMNRTVKKLLVRTLIERTIPDSPNHPAQKFRITPRGKAFLKLLAQPPLNL